MSGCLDGIVMLAVVVFLFLLASAYVSNPMFWLFMLMILIVSVAVNNSLKRT